MINKQHTSAEVKRKIEAMRDAEVLARLLWGECRGEMPKGQVAVACVVMNRVADRRYGYGIKGVCLRPWQFSCFNDNDPNLPLLLSPPRLAPFERCELVAGLAVEDLLKDPTAGATHYFNPRVVPGGWPRAWNRDLMVDCGVIGRHWFWRERR